jgi:hypothetical protein
MTSKTKKKTIPKLVRRAVLMFFMEHPEIWKIYWSGEGLPTIYLPIGLEAIDPSSDVINMKVKNDLHELGIHFENYKPKLSKFSMKNNLTRGDRPLRTNEMAVAYELWDELPQTKINIALHGDVGESLWGRKLPNGWIGLDNEPLHKQYRWKDIVQPQGTAPIIMNRYWGGKINFLYEPLKNEKEDQERRKEITDSGSQAGHVSFFAPGIGYILTRLRRGALKDVEEAFKKLPYMKTLEIA